MNLIRFNSRNAVPTFNRSFDRIFDNFFKDDFKLVGRDFAQTVPAVNIKENENDFVIELAAPGLKKEDFKEKV